ncbi:MAG: hypothetical protein KJ955_01740 [Nanoarchaeota archaeon]|nr:hypothetical protein [Nanoarchaeota archaeon]
MKVEFNEDGSIKLPELITKQKEENKKIFQNEPSIKIIRNQISSVRPLDCELKLHASDKLGNFEMIGGLFREAEGKFRHMANLSIKRVDGKMFIIRIISGQYRCDWCHKFRELLKNEFDSRVIDEGSCLEYISSK